MVTGVTWASHSPCYLIAVRSESWESCRLSCFPAEWVPAAAANAVPSMEKTFLFLSCLVVAEDMNYRDLPCLSAPFSPPPPLSLFPCLSVQPELLCLCSPGWSWCWDHKSALNFIRLLTNGLHKSVRLKTNCNDNVEWWRDTDHCIRVCQG